MLLQRTGYVPLYPVLGLLGAYAQAFTVVPACKSSIYCSGELLHTVQLSRIFRDSKTFVDLKIQRSENETLSNFSSFMKKTNRKPSRQQLLKFVDQNFEEGNELENWMPPDFDPNPPILNKVSDPALKEFTKNVISIWAKLGRKVRTNVKLYPNQYSFLYVPNGFIVPGGRFKELYYWDSLWIIRGLLISNMTQTAKGMVENLLYLVEKYGYIPNGSRVYYLGRSQPPLLAAMVSSYYEATKDITFLEQHVGTVEKELKYWLVNKKVDVEIRGKKYRLLRYLADKGKGPRPESYFEDYTNAESFSNEDRRQDFYAEMKSAAESGWDFSSRWFVTAANVIGNLSNVHTTRIIPVDLNAIFAGALETVGNFRNILKDKSDAQKWWTLSGHWKNAIQNVMYDSEDGVWYDYDAKDRALKKYFYPSCATPLWTGVVKENVRSKYAARLVKYLKSTGALAFPGGIPSSLLHSGEQWDFPNAWPPMHSILIGGLNTSGNDEAQNLAKEQARKWIRANYIGFSTWQKMFEKYNAVEAGHQGGGGEYGVQDGFGWTNGVFLELIQRYPHLTLNEQPDTSPTVSLIP